MDSVTTRRLLDINWDFYRRFGADFSATRRRLQRGVMRILGTLTGDESILDLGCGNGELARTLARRGHRGPYLGLDFSLPLLHEAGHFPDGFSARFVEADLTKLSVLSEQLSVPLWTAQSPDSTGSPETPNVETKWSLITCFATLHHIPSRELRLHLIETIRELLAPDGKFILSNWQFLNSSKLRGRVQPWERVGLTQADVDEDDYLLDWRRGGNGLRYAHHFSEKELKELADATRFHVEESFYSDGEGGRLGLYQVWI